MIELRVLGGIDLRDHDGTRIESVLSQSKRLALLTYLAVANAGAPVRRDSLLALFWPESNDSRARNSLNQAIHQLRRSLGAGVIEVTGEAEVGLARHAFWCDVVAFDQALERDQLEEAVQLYRGPFLEGFHLAGASEFEAWAERERARFGRYTATAIARLVSQSDNEPEAAVRWAERGYVLAPTDEDALCRLLSSLAAAGRAGVALQHYEVFASRLRQDAGAEPSARTRALAAEILERSEQPQAAEPSLPADDTAVSVPAAAPRPAPESRQAPTRAPLLLRYRYVLMAAALSAVIAAAAWWVWSTRGPQMPADGVSRVAVLPFSVGGGDGIGYLREGLAEILSARLDGAGELRTVDSNVVIGFAESVRSRPAIEQGRAVARQFGTRYFIAGRVTAAGDRLEVTTTLYEADGRPVTRASVSVAEQDVLSAVDALARELVGSTVGGVYAPLLRAAAITTHSFPALKAYLEGERAYRDNRMSDMRAALERALAEDSTFALAHYRLAVAAEWTGGPVHVIERSLASADRHGERLSARHRLLVAGLQAYWHGNYRQAYEGYRRAVMLYPDDLEAWHRLAELQFHRMPALGHPFTEARVALERVLALEPENEGALNHLTRIAATEGRAAELDTLTTRALATADPIQAIELRLIRAFANGDGADRARAIAEAEAMPPDLATVSAVRVLSHTADPDGAERLLARLVDPTRPAEIRVAAGVQRVELAAAAGRWVDARQRLHELAELAPVPALALEASLAILPVAPADPQHLMRLRERIAAREAMPAGVDTVTGGLVVFRSTAWPALRRFFLGALSVRLGDSAAAAAALDALGRDSIAVQYQLPTTLRALVALEARQYATALAATDSLSPGDPAVTFARQDALGRYLHAVLLREAGRDAEAMRWFGTFGDLGGWDLALLAPSELARAEIAEGLGQSAAAAHHYSRAIALWKDADAQAPIAAARARLRRLQRDAS